MTRLSKLGDWITSEKMKRRLTLGYVAAGVVFGMLLAYNSVVIRQQVKINAIQANKACTTLQTTLMWWKSERRAVKLLIEEDDGNPSAAQIEARQIRLDGLNEIIAKREKLVCDRTEISPEGKAP